MSRVIDSSCIIDKDKLEYFKHYRDITLVEKISIIQAWILDQPQDKDLIECYTEFNKALYNESVNIDYWYNTFSCTKKEDFREIIYNFEYKIFSDLDYKDELPKIEVKYDNKDPKVLMRNTLLKQIEINNDKINSNISDDDLKVIIDSNNELFNEIYNINNEINKNEF